MTQKLVGGVTTVLLPPNLLTNPSVEEPSGGDWPDAWNWSASNATRSAAQAHDGSKSLRVNPTASTGEWLSSLYTVVGGVNYRLCGYFKGTGGGECFLTVRWWSDVGGTQFVGEQNIALSDTYADWTEISGVFWAPGGAVRADVMFRCPAPTTVDIYGDSFYLGRA